MPIALPKQLRSVSDKALLKKLETGLERVEEALLNAVSHTDPIASVTARHLAAAGGKRMRPALVLLTAQLGDDSNPDVIEAALVEFANGGKALGGTKADLDRECIA